MAVCSSWRSNASRLLMHVMLIVLFLLYLCLGGRDGSMVERSCIESERRALLSIKGDMYDPDQWLSSWKSQDYCRWRGVGCNNITGHVVLDLSDNEISGEIPEFIENLIHLQSLDLSYNKISGEIPDAFDRLHSLHYLALSSNRITGKIPRFIGNLCKLNGLDISHNSITGELVDTIESWSKCTENKPDGRRSLQGLTSLHVGYNNLSGTIPQTLSQLSALQELDLASNSFTEILDLSNNNLSGGIRLFCNGLASLEVLDLSNNELFGELHHYPYKPRYGTIDSKEDNKFEHSFDSVACPVKLQSLHLRNNRLSGKLPSWLKYCRQLLVLDLSENRFSDNLPIWIGESLRSLRVLSLRLNFFNGSIPAQLSYLTSLPVLDLACNNFSGALPPSFGNLSAMKRTQNAEKPMLTDFHAYYTEGLVMTIKGIEIEYTSVLSFVISIDLSCNNLSGTIPIELVNLHGLRFLNLSNNHFTGKIPKNIGALTQLESLDLSVNNLSGWHMHSPPDLANPMSVEAEALQSLVEKASAHLIISTLHVKLDGYKTSAIRSFEEIMRKLLHDQHVVKDVMPSNDGILL
uniref:Receptor-like protein 12 n=1 Tax=Elaeis guineensis var. tenera TaxID=51953 RepID=A0A8N4F2A9_ELAGV|nr:receptor-like protein 12 [Elaeis guineensis]